MMTKAKSTADVCVDFELNVRAYQKRSSGVPTSYVCSICANSVSSRVSSCLLLEKFWLNHGKKTKRPTIKAPTLAAVKEARSFLYRGAALAEDGRPRLVVERSDLLDEGKTVDRGYMIHDQAIVRRVPAQYTRTPSHGSPATAPEQSVFIS